MKFLFIWAWFLDKSADLLVRAAVLMWPFGSAERGIVSFCRKDPACADGVGLYIVAFGFLMAIFGVTVPFGPLGMAVSWRVDPLAAFWFSVGLIGIGGIVMRAGHLLRKWKHPGYRMDLIVRLAGQAVKFRASKIALLAEAEGERVLAMAVGEMPAGSVKGLSRELMARMIASRDRDVRIAAIKIAGSSRMKFLDRAMA